MGVPQTHYARSGGVHIAFQEFGDGPLDLVIAPPIISHVELGWEIPLEARWRHRLADFARVIVFDKRGTGMSDRTEVAASLDDRIDDIRAVMDAAGSQRAALMGLSDGGPMASLFTATFPDRVSSLILWATFARALEAPDYPYGYNREAQSKVIETLTENWGTGVTADHFMADDPEGNRELMARIERNSVSPGMLGALFEASADIDVRAILPLIRVPTLAVSRTGDPLFESTRYMSSLIDGSRFVELKGADHVPWLGDQNEAAALLQEFLTGARRAIDVDRVLSTVLFTDIVGSTVLAAELGDRVWRRRLDEYEEVLTRQIELHRGRLVSTSGDGALATFDGPARAVRCAVSIRKAVRELGLRVTSGLHTGEIEVRGDDIAGIAVHIGARVASLAVPDEVLVSGTVRDLVIGSDLSFEDRGSHALKGVPDECRIYEVTDLT